MGKELRDKSDVRIDKWLWAVRLFKTRSLSAEACSKGRVIIDNVQVKPSRIVKKGDIIKLIRPPALFTYRVIETVNNRQPAKMVDEYLENITPEEEKEKFFHKKMIVFSDRQRGTGRPTKKDRRDIDKFKDFG